MNHRPLLALAGVTAAALVAPAVRAENPKLNDQVRLQVSVERGGVVRPLAAVPSLEKGDLVSVRLLTAAGYQKKFPHVANQRVSTMKADHGLMVVLAFVGRSANYGLSKESFPRPTLSKDGDALIYKVPADAATPFVFLVPALYDSAFDRTKEFDQIIELCNRDEAIRGYLLRRIGNPADNGVAGVGRSEPNGPDEVLKKTQFLLPRIAAAQQLRQNPTFRSQPIETQTAQLYAALGVSAPQSPDGLTYVDHLLDAFVSSDPNNPIQLPKEQQIGAVLQTGFTMLPGWFSSYLTGISLFGKLGLLLSGRPTVHDERYFVSALPFPEIGDTQASRFRVDTSEPLYAYNPQKKDQRRKNILVLGFGRTELTKLPIKTAGDGVVYLHDSGLSRALSLDSKSPLSPDQLNTFAARLRLEIVDGPNPGSFPLTYEPRTGSFLLTGDAPLPAMPATAVLRGDWGGRGELVEVSSRFRIAGVRPQRWQVENVDNLLAGQSGEVKLRTDSISRPAKVTLRYQNGETIDAREIVDMRGWFAVRFDLSGRRPGAARLEVYQAGLETPDWSDSGTDTAGTPLPVQVFDPLKGAGLADLRYYAADNRLLVRRAAFTPASIPAKIELGGATFEPMEDNGDDWLSYTVAYTGANSTAPAGLGEAKLLLRDGRRTLAPVRVRPRRPSFAINDVRPQIMVRLPFALPPNALTQHAPIEITLSAADGYRFSRTSRLLVGGATLTPDPLITSASGAQSVRFLLDPAVYRSLRGQLAFRIAEDRENGETVTSDEAFLPVRLIDAPDPGLSLEWANGRYRLRGTRLDALRAAGVGDALEPVAPMSVGNNVLQVEFRGAPGQPISLLLRDSDVRLPWTGPIVPATPDAPSAEATKDAVMVRFKPAMGASGYRVYRDTNPDFTPSPQNRVAEVSGAATAEARDGKPRGAGETLYYKVVAVSRTDNFPTEFESTPSSASAPLAPAAAPATTP